MLRRGLRNDAMPQIKYERAMPEDFQSVIDAAFECIAATYQKQRIKISLHRCMGLDFITDKFQRQ